MKINLISIAAVSAAITFLLFTLLRARKFLSNINRDLDTAILHNERQAEEIRSWRRLFGPFPSLYENSPEADAGSNGNDKTIAIDLDGVILDYVDPWKGVAHFGDPIPGAAEAIGRLKELGYKIAIYTTRNNTMACHNKGYNALELTALVQARLEDGKIPYDFISLFKPLARYYIDDRAIRFTSWAQAVRQVGYLERGRMVDRIHQLCDNLEVPLGEAGLYRE